MVMRTMGVLQPVIVDNGHKVVVDVQDLVDALRVRCPRRHHRGHVVHDLAISIDILVLLGQHSYSEYNGSKVRVQQMMTTMMTSHRQMPATQYLGGITLPHVGVVAIRPAIRIQAAAVVTAPTQPHQLRQIRADSHIHELYLANALEEPDVPQGPNLVVQHFASAGLAAAQIHHTNLTVSRYTSPMWCRAKQTPDSAQI